MPTYITPELAHFDTPYGDFEVGELLRVSEKRGWDYWSVPAWRIRRARKYDYILKPAARYRDGAAHLHETVFRVPVGATDQIDSDTLDDLVVCVQSKYQPFTDLTNDADLGTFNRDGDWELFRIETPPAAPGERSEKE